MAIQLSITNVFRFISYITPVLLIFFMIMISVFNQDVKGLIYLGGVLIAIFITVACKNMIKHPSDNFKFCVTIDPKPKKQFFPIFTFPAILDL